MDNYTNNLPDRIKKYLNDRGLTDSVLKERQISYNGKIVIPIFNKDGQQIFNKYRKDPATLNDKAPKYTYDKGAKSALYGVDLLIKHPEIREVIICEGEFDALVLLSHGFLAVTSTGGAGTFSEEWKHYFNGKRVYVCFDNDSAGRKGTVNVIRLLPEALCLPLPGEVKDVTDYFVNLKKTAHDFRHLRDFGAFELEIPQVEPPKPKHDRRSLSDGINDFDKAKQVPISEFISVNHDGFASCPFHKEKTASMKVDKNNRFYCFGCSKWGDVIDIVQHIYSLAGPRDAVNYILKK